jgi:uncharacterized protein YbjT (DUF2867 family)
MVAHRSRMRGSFGERGHVLMVLVAGANGQIGQHLVRLLAEKGHEVRAMIRSEDQAQLMRGLGGVPLVADLEGDITDTAAGCDAVVFTAGGGPGSGDAKKETVDLGGAVKLIETARRHGASRYVIISAMGAADPEAGSEGMRPYLRAKARADEALRESGLDYTIIRPGSLTNEPGTGRVAAAESLGRRGAIPREDVARATVATLETQSTVGKTFELLSGDDPIDTALRAL